MFEKIQKAPVFADNERFAATPVESTLRSAKTHHVLVPTLFNVPSDPCGLVAAMITANIRIDVEVNYPLLFMLPDVRSSITQSWEPFIQYKQHSLANRRVAARLAVSRSAVCGRLGPHWERLNTRLGNDSARAMELLIRCVLLM